MYSLHVQLPMPHVCVLDTWMDQRRAMVSVPECRGIPHGKIVPSVSILLHPLQLIPSFAYAEPSPESSDHSRIVISHIFVIFNPGLPSIIVLLTLISGLRPRALEMFFALHTQFLRVDILLQSRHGLRLSSTQRLPSPLLRIFVIQHMSLVT
jgi:hypothetical protein